MKNRMKVIISVAILCFIGTGIYYLVQSESIDLNKYTEKEKFIMSKVDKAKNLVLIQSEYSDNVEYYLFTCTINGDKNLGYAAFYHEDIQNKVYNDNNNIVIDYNKEYLDQPFIIGQNEFDTPTKYIDNGMALITYRYFFGNVNDANIKKIIIDFPDEALHIDVSEGYYSVISHSINNPEYITGVDEDYNKIYEYTLKK